LRARYLAKLLENKDGDAMEKVMAAIEAHPLLRDDLCTFLADYLLMQATPDEDPEAEDAAAAAADDAMVTRIGDRLKHMLRGLDIARMQDAGRTA
jgi:hypothetical protein